MPCEHGKVYWWHCTGCRENERVRQHNQHFEYEQKILKALKQQLESGKRPEEEG